MAWCRIGVKLLFEPMMAQFTDAYTYVFNSSGAENNISEGPGQYHGCWCPVSYHCQVNNSDDILGLRPANERRRYKVTPSLIGWEQT